jgi:ABC-type transport system involved in multi-copper enzyme maturation permease subunit
MLSLIIRKEILEHLLSLRFAISCILCFVVILSSVFVLTKDYREDMLDYRTNLVMHRNQVLGYEHPWEVAGQGIQVDKPLNVMKIFLKGISQQNTTTVRVYSWGEPEFQGASESNPVIHLFPTIDLVFFVSIIMSLLAMVFSYDAVSGEKEQGTLRLMMSYSVPRDTILLGKWIGGYAALIAPFLISFLCGLIVMLMFPDAHLTGANWIQLATIVGIAFLYISAMYSLGLLVSTRTHMASTSITVLLMIWVVMALVIPNLSPY